MGIFPNGACYFVYLHFFHIVIATIIILILLLLLTMKIDVFKGEITNVHRVARLRTMILIWWMMIRILLIRTLTTIRTGMISWMMMTMIRVLVTGRKNPTIIVIKLDVMECERGVCVFFIRHELLRFE